MGEVKNEDGKGCKACMKHKTTRFPSNKIKMADIKTRKPLQLVHNDVCFPIWPELKVVWKKVTAFVYSAKNT